MRVAIVDDEPLARARLRRLLMAQDVEVIAEGENGNDAVAIAADQTIDLIFLDINMPSKNGLQAAQEIEQQITNPPTIVFCTAYDQFAVQAFKTNAVAYLLKPFSEADLVQALAKASKLSRLQLDQIALMQEPYAKLSLKVGDGVEVVSLNDISHFHSEDKYVFATVVDQGPIFIDKSLKLLEQEYSLLFVRTHRNSLVNTAHIARIFKGDSGQAFVELSSGINVAVSRRHYVEVKKCLN